MVALLIGIIFYGQTLTQDGVQNINGAIFLYLTNMTFQNVFAVINVSIAIFLYETVILILVFSGLLCRATCFYERIKIETI